MKQFILTSILLVLVGNAAQAAEKSALTKSQPGTFQVKFSKGYLSVDANNAPFGKLFEVIGKQAGIAVESGIGPEEKITIHFDRLPLEEGIKQLSKNVTIFYGQDSEGKTRRIAKVVVLSEDKQNALKERVKTPSQPAKVDDDPASKPEPFKFEFDPSKSAGKEKSR